MGKFRLIQIECLARILYSMAFVLDVPGRAIWILSFRLISQVYEPALIDENIRNLITKHNRFHNP